MIYTEKLSHQLATNDPWILSSLLQKSIRRGDVLLAQTAVLKLHAHNSQRAWRRLLLIAFEDVGIGSIDALVAATAFFSRFGRRAQPDDRTEVVHLSVQLAECRKDRSADYLYCGSVRHPALELARRQFAISSNTERLLALNDPTCRIEMRAICAWYLSGLQKVSGMVPGDRGALLAALIRTSNSDAQLSEATRIALNAFREPFVLMVPLLAAHLKAGAGSKLTPRQDVVPKSKLVGDTPMYALDKHTRVGRTAIRELLADNDNVRRCLKEYVSQDRMKEAAYMAAYYADATPISNRFVWAGSDNLEILGTEADLYHAGVPLEGVKPILQTFRNNLVHLDEIRARLFSRQFGGGGL